MLHHNIHNASADCSKLDRIKKKKSFMDTQDMEKEKLTTQTSQKGLESRLENTWSLIPGLGAVWTACVRYLSNSLIQLLLASLLLMRAI